MTPRVLINHERRIMVEVLRTKTKVRCVTPERDLRWLPVEWSEHVGKVFIRKEFDRVWQPYTDHTVEQVIFKWLEAHNRNHIPLTERARKELIMVLVTTAEHKFVAKFADMETALKSVATGNLVYAAVEEMVETLTGKDLAILVTSVTGQEVTGGRVKDKEKAAKLIWETVEGMKVEAPSVPRQTTPKVPAGPKKVGIKQQIREVLVAGGKFTLDELLAKFGADKKASIVTALSDLKSDKYAREGGKLNIIRDEEHRYHVA